jgi:GAF domain-containing protein
VPLVSEGQCIGTLNVLRAQPDWSEEEVTLVRVLGLVTLSGVLMLRT